jgi:6-phosphogluconolactonase
LFSCVLLTACGDDGGGTGTDSATGTASTTAGTSATSMSSTTMATATTTTATSGPTTTTTTTSTTGTTGTTGNVEPPEGTFYVFVSSNGNEVTTWSMDPTDGALTNEGTATTTGNGIGPLAISPDLSTVYAATGGSQEVTAFSVDQNTGLLTSLGATGLGFNAVYLSVDPSGGYLLSATFGGDEIAVFPIGNDGAVGATASSRIQNTPQEPHSIRADPSGQWVLVPHRTPDLVGQYAFDDQTGVLTANAVASVDAEAGSGPRHLAFNPSNDHVYVANEFSDSVSVYAFDTMTGQLTLGDTTSTIPQGFDPDSNTCADIHITPDGQYLYVSNRGHDSLAMFSVSADGAMLTSLGQVDTEATPREFEVSPRGRYVYSAGQDSGMMASYTVADDGTLTPGTVYDVGDTPLWVLAIEIPPA